MGREHHPSNVVPQCTAIEPITRTAMCERNVGHDMPHRVEVFDAAGGRTLVEWVDRSRLFAPLWGGRGQR